VQLSYYSKVPALVAMINVNCERFTCRGCDRIRAFVRLTEYLPILANDLKHDRQTGIWNYATSGYVIAMVRSKAMFMS
jgi:hypothetical protein